MRLRWLQGHRPGSGLVAESARVWRFILALEVEAPDRFRAIQSYRCRCGPVPLLQRTDPASCKEFPVCLRYNGFV